MNRHVKALTLLLALQVAVLAGVLLWQQRATSTTTGTLLRVDRSRVDGVVVVDDKGDKLKLRRVDSLWTLPDSQGLPADGDKINALIDKLIAASAPWPIATSAESAKRFEVARDKFQREIQLTAGDQVIGDLYLGTSPGFKKVHARRADSDDVYAIDFANYDATARADDWLDKTLLKPAGDITALARSGHWRLQRSGDAWSLDGLAQGESMKQDAITDVVNKVANLRVSGVAGAAPPDGSEPALVLTASTANGEFDYRFFRPQPSGDFVVARSGRDGYFKVAAYVAEPLIKERTDFIGGGAAAEAVVAPAALVPLRPPAKPIAKAPAKPATTPATKPDAG